MVLILGVDEAGRGPVIGSLFIAGVYLEDSEESKLKEIKVRDSKLILKKKRFEIYEDIKRVAKHVLIKVEPNEIDSFLERDDLNLNWLEAHKTAEIINKVNPSKVYIDSPSPNKKAYSDYIRKLLKNKEVELIVDHKAESKYPVVAAASIVAKVNRDREVESLEKRYGNIGPGYTSNPITQKFVKENWDKHPELFRKSWITWKNHKDAKEQKKLDEF
ncbi:ribonuclease HII [Candidatus Woesearchaeota archaeon]|nr:ribonuclease HII [Candidatus Woesearchaeota archaeon]